MASKTMAETEQLPMLPEEVTAEWLGSKLGHKIESVAMTRSIFGTASKLFFTITYADLDPSPSSEDERPTHVCIKGVFDPAMVVSQPWTVSLAQKESDFFAKIAPLIEDTGMGFPKGWWAGKSDRQGIAVMSDLTHKGCSFAPEVASYPVEMVLDGVAQLAELHAKFWGKSQEDMPWIDNNYDPAMTFMVRPWDTIVRTPGRPQLPEFLMDGTRINTALDRYYAERNPRFRTLLHGDTHVGNVYFTAANQLSFLDWSAFHFGSCFHDIVYFMTTLLTVEDRRQHEMAVLDHYLAELHRCGGPKFDRSDEELMVEYKRSFMTNVIWLICPDGLQTKERVAELCMRTVATWEDHDVLGVIERQPVPGNADA